MAHPQLSRNSSRGFWLTGGVLVTPTGTIRGAVRVAQGRIAAIQPAAPKHAQTLSAKGCYIAPGFIDLHIWGEPVTVAKDIVRTGTTGFLTTLGPALKGSLLDALSWRATHLPSGAAECLGFHLEGPFVNSQRSGALPRQGMRAPTVHELEKLQRASLKKLKVLTLAPELSGATAAIGWCRRQKIAVSLGHSLADAKTASQAVDAGASLVTHIFNGMPGFHHRKPSLLDAALLDRRLTTMVIADGIHTSAEALKLLFRIKGPKQVALVTDSIRHQGWDVVSKGGAYYTRDGTLAGSQLTLLEAVKNMVELAGVPLCDAVSMASEVPARVLGLAQSRGTIAAGKRADLVAFDSGYKAHWTMIGGRMAYQRGN